MTAISEHDTEDVRGSSPVMSAKDLLLEVYRDMKMVRPAVEALQAAAVVARIETLERAALAAQALGLNERLVQRVGDLENINEAKLAANLERRRLGDLTNKTIAIIVLVSNAFLGAIVLIGNLMTERAVTV